MSEINLIESQLKLLKAQFDHNKELRRLTGHDFNVFQILKLSTNEVRTHSALIAELLNPKGSHGQADKFLKLFIDIICDHQIFSEYSDKNIRQIESEKLSNLKSALRSHKNFNDVIIEIEKPIGKRNVATPEKESGRMDIVIKSDGFQIVIENKINSKLGEDQLYRYCAWAETAQPKGVVFYLALRDNESIEELNESATIKTKDARQYLFNKDYYRITYENHIIHWLKNCKKEAVSLPVIRETITQYINLINNLTNNPMNNPAIIDIIKKNPAIANTIIDSHKALAEHLINLRQKIFSAMIEKYLANELNKEINSQYIILKEITMSNSEKISVCFGEDSGGVFIGYKIDKKFDTAERLKHYQQIFERINVYEVKKNIRWIAWFNPSSTIFSANERLQEMDLERLLNAFSDENFSNSINTICEKESEVTANFIKAIQS